MQELKILKQLVSSIEEQWSDKSLSERSEIAHTLSAAQIVIRNIMDGYKDELRAIKRDSDDRRIPTVGKDFFLIGEPKTYWVLKEDADLMKLQRELGAMFNVLFYAKLKTTPKFEETLLGLPERQKTVLLENVEPRQQKATVRLITKRDRVMKKLRLENETQSHSDQ